MTERLTISNELFVDFIRKSTLEGEISQLLLTQTDLGYNVNVVSENVITCFGTLLKKNFTMFGKVGNITIKDVKKFIAMLKDFAGNVVIERKENKIIIYFEKTEIEYVLCSEEFIETTLKEDVDIEFDSGFKLNKDFLTNLISKANLLDVSSITLKVENNILRGIVEETDKITIKEEVNYKNCVSSFGRWLFKLSRFLEEKINVSFDENYPIKIVSKNTNFQLTYIIAPFVKTEETIEEETEEEKEEERKQKEDD